MGNPLPSSDERKKGQEIEGATENGNGPFPPDLSVTEERRNAEPVTPQDREERLHGVVLSSSKEEKDGGSDPEPGRTPIKEEKQETEEQRLGGRDQSKVEESSLSTDAMAPSDVAEESRCSL